MTNQTVPFDGQARERAIALLAAAEDLDLPARVVETRTGAFYAPAEVIEKAGLSDAVEGADSSLSEDDAPAEESGDEPPAKPKRGRAKNSQED